MFNLLAFRFFPYDPAIDSALGHRHLILVYCLIWLAHAAYAAYVVSKWMSVRREESRVATSEARRS
jgi:hypothetical protein